MYIPNLPVDLIRNDIIVAIQDMDQLSYQDGDDSSRGGRSKRGRGSGTGGRGRGRKRARVDDTAAASASGAASSTDPLKKNA